MNRYFVALVMACGLLVACESTNETTMNISKVRILAPLPGSNMSVAYLSISNRSNERSQLVGVSSPQFGKIEMHATTITDGIARMRPLANVAIPANSTVEFAPGGLHIMLMDPIDDLAPGMQISMQFNFDGNLLVVTATLQERNPSR